VDAPGSRRRGGRPDPLLGLDHLTGSRSAPFVVLGLLVLGAGLLAGCGGAARPAAARVLTNADLSPSLALAENHSNTAVNLGKALTQVYPGCVGHFAVFTDHGRVPTSDATGPTSREVFSEASLCPSADKATSVFDRAARAVEVKKVGGRAISGMADAAVLAQFRGGGAHEYALFVRDGSVLGFVQLTGPSGDPTVTATEIKVLARRQLARQSVPGS
jgi:hypothetical protein